MVFRLPLCCCSGLLLSHDSEVLMLLLAACASRLMSICCPLSIIFWILISQFRVSAGELIWILPLAYMDPL